jgi:HK97 family phage portal protein
MGMMDKIAATMGYEKRAADPSWAALGSNVGYPATLSARASENLSSVLGCVTAISSALASIPALVYQVNDNGRKEVEKHPLRNLIRNGVNDSMGWPDFIEHWTASALLTGNGLAQIERDRRGQVSTLRYIPWQWVSVVELTTGRLAYDVSDGKGKSWRLLQSEVLHLRDRTDNGLVGRSRLSRAANTVAAITASNDFAREFLINGAQPSGVIKSPAILSLEQIKNIKAQFQERYSGAKNAGRTLVLDNGLDWSAAQVSPEDAELLETRKFGVEEICRLFQVPPPLVQDYSHNTFTNSETAGRLFAMFCLTPWARKIEAEFCRSLFSSASQLEMELDLTGFLRGDPATRWQAHAIALSNNVLDPNEVRQVEGWNPRAEQAL